MKLSCDMGSIIAWCIIFCDTASSHDPRAVKSLVDITDYVIAVSYFDDINLRNSVVHGTARLSS